MNRQLLIGALVGVALMVLSVALRVLQTQTQDDLDQAQQTATQSAANHATQVAQINATATGVRVAAVATQAVLEDDLATQTAAFGAQGEQLSGVESTATQSAEDFATQSARIDATATGVRVAAVATQAALEDDLATQTAAFGAQGEQLSGVESTATQSADDFATQSAQINATATGVRVAAVATQAALEDDLATQTAAFGAQGEQLSGVESTATQSADDFATQSARINATATGVYAAAVATQSALRGDLATQNAALTAQEGEFTGLAMTATQNAVAMATAVAHGEDQQATVQAQAAHIETLEAPVALSDEPLASVAVSALVVRDDFNDDSRWPTGPVPGAGILDLRAGQYWLTVGNTPGNIQVISLPFVADVYLEAEITLDSCPPDGYFAVAARAGQELDEFTGYYFTFSCDLSLWAILLRSGTGDWVALAVNSFTPSSTDPAQSHVVGVWAQGATLKLYFDGDLLGSATDDTFAGGEVGFYGESVGSDVIIKVESLRVWLLP